MLLKWFLGSDVSNPRSESRQDELKKRPFGFLHAFCTLLLRLSRKGNGLVLCPLQLREGIHSRFYCVSLAGLGPVQGWLQEP